MGAERLSLFSWFEKGRKENRFTSSKFHDLECPLSNTAIASFVLRGGFHAYNWYQFIGERSVRKIFKQNNRAQQTRSNFKTSQKRPQKRKILQPILCLSVLVLSFSTTSTVLAFVDLGSTRRILDTVGRVTDNEDIKSASESLSTVDDYLHQAQEFYRNISHKNIPGTIRQLESILGQLGILDPSNYPRTISDVLDGATGSSPGTVSGGTPTTPGQIYTQQQILTDTANSDQLWIYTDSVLGKGAQEGQSRLQAMNKTSLASAEASIRGQERSASQSQKAFQNADIARSASESAERLSGQAQQRNVSQDIFKDVAAQQSELAKSNSAIANQLATLSDQQVTTSSQMSALATQSQVANQHLTELQVGQSIGNIQLHDIFNAQRHANQMEIQERQKNAQLVVGSTDAIYIPGLFSEQP